MGDAESTHAGEPKARGSGGAIGYSFLSIPEEKTMKNLYGKLTPDQRTWRCEQMKKSSDLLEKSWELLRPISEGQWDQDKAYNGISLFIKAIYTGQGYAALPTALGTQLGEVMRIVQDHMPFYEIGGRRVQGDDNPARYALRVTFNCIATVTCTGFNFGEDKHMDQELQEKVMLMVRSSLDKLGGPLTHEGTLTAEEKGYILRLATAGGPAEVQRLVTSTPVNVLALYMLQAQYDIDLRVVKWVLHYAAVRCCKEEYGRVRSQPGAAHASPACVAARAAWQTHSQALDKLEPGSPLAAFMVAEARSSEAFNPGTLALMRAATACAERRGDDLVAWLAHLNVAYMLIHGALGDTFVEDEVLKVMDAAAHQRASVSRWGGTVLTESRCRTLKEALYKDLDQAREQRQTQLAQAQAAGGSGSLAEGRLPVILDSGQWAVMTPSAVPHRECAGCNKYFHKAMACGRCKSVWYCGRECQAAHWKAGHKAQCAKLAAAREAGGPKEEDDD